METQSDELTLADNRASTDTGSVEANVIEMTMRTRKAIVWVIVVLLAIPIAIFVSGDPSIVIDNASLTAGLLLILSLIVTSWKLKRRLKKRMERGLGRNVDDSELTSISAWMRIPEQAAQAGREAEKYDLD